MYLKQSRVWSKIKIYTDGSRVNDSTGVGYYMNNKELNVYKRLEEGIAISSAELNAMLALKVVKKSNLKMYLYVRK